MDSRPRPSHEGPRKRGPRPFRKPGAPRSAPSRPGPPEPSSDRRRPRPPGPFHPPRRQAPIRHDPVEPATPKPPSPLSLAESVVVRANRERPADVLLRETLREARGLDRTVSGEIARWVFGYYRWRGFLARGLPLPRQILAATKFAQRFAEDPRSFSDAALARAVPDWVPEHLDAPPGWCRSLQAEPTLWLRTRPGTAESVMVQLDDCRQPFAETIPDALVYEGARDLHRHELFQQGAFEIQDLASQIVGLVCGARPRETWWDACAGEGGKTLLLADSMANQGVVWATDRMEWRLKQLRLRAARAGLFNIRWAAWDGGSKRPVGGNCDGVLVDAPCSGLGTWQRNPHARWIAQPGDFAELARLQSSLLTHAAPAVKPGGRLVYAVCSLTREETTGVTAAFEKVAADFEPCPVPDSWRRGAATRPGIPAHHLWLWPEDWGGNGMFVATWRRRADRRVIREGPG